MKTAHNRKQAAAPLPEKDLIIEILPIPKTEGAVFLRALPMQKATLRSKENQQHREQIFASLPKIGKKSLTKGGFCDFYKGDTGHNCVRKR